MPQSERKRKISKCEKEILELFMQEFRNRMEYKELNASKLASLMKENGAEEHERTLGSYLQKGKDRETDLSFTKACFISKVLDFSLDTLRDKCLSNARVESIQQEEYEQHFIKKTADYERLKEELWERYKSICYWKAAYFDGDTFKGHGEREEEREHSYIAECRKDFDAKLKERNDDLFLLSNEISELELCLDEIEGH